MVSLWYILNEKNAFLIKMHFQKEFYKNN